MHNYQKHTALKTRNTPGVMRGGTTCNKFFQRTCNAGGVHLLEGTFGSLQFAIKKAWGGVRTCNALFQRTCNVPGVGGAFGTLELEDSSGLVPNSCIRLVTHLVCISWKEPSAPSSLLSRRLVEVRTCNVFFQRTCNAPG